MSSPMTRPLPEPASWVRQLRPDVVIACSISGFPAVELAHLAGASSWLRIGEYESPAMGVVGSVNR